MRLRRSLLHMRREGESANDMYIDDSRVVIGHVCVVINMHKILHSGRYLPKHQQFKECERESQNC